MGNIRKWRWAFTRENPATTSKWDAPRMRIPRSCCCDNLNVITVLFCCCCADDVRGGDEWRSRLPAQYGRHVLLASTVALRVEHCIRRGLAKICHMSSRWNFSIWFDVDRAGACTVNTSAENWASTKATYIHSKEELQYKCNDSIRTRLYTWYVVSFGHLAMDMMRACRLVIDTGLHAFESVP